MRLLPHWRLSAWYFWYFAFIGAFAAYFTLYLQSIGQSAFAISVLMALQQVMRLLAPTLWGWLADRMGRKVPIIRFSALLSLSGFSLFFITRQFAGLFAAMAVMAFFWSAALPLVEALTLAALQGQTERYGRVRLWGSVGFIVAVLGVGLLLEVAPLDAVLWVCAGCLAGIFVCALLLRDIASPAHSPSLPPLGAALRRPAVVAFLVASFFMSAAHGPLYVFYSIHLVDAGYGKATVGVLWSLGVLAEILIFLAMPRLLKRISLRGLLLTSLGTAVVRFLLVGWSVESLGWMVLAQVMHGMTFGAFHAASVAMLNRWFGHAQQARVQAIYSSVSFGAGGMLGALVAGQAWESLGAAMTYTLGAVFAAIGLILLWRSAPDRSPGNAEAS